MIRTVIKSCLKKAIGRATLTQEELCVVLVELEALVNLRLLTYVKDHSHYSTLWPIMKQGTYRT